MAKISQTLAIVCLLLNILILPGLGTTIARATQKKEVKNGVWQLVLAIVGIPLILVIIGFFMMIAAWVWALIDGIKIIKEAS